MPSSHSLTLVTGGGGFIGLPLCRALVRQARVRALVRRRASSPGVEQVVIDDLLQPEGLRRALTGVTSVVHLAARVHETAVGARDSLELFRKTNVEGTRLLLEEAATAGVRRFLFLSSVKAVGESNSEAWNEESAPRPVTPYGISKLEAETVVREGGRRLGLETVILRLPLVYGPGVRANALQLVRLIEWGVPLPLGRVRNRRSMVALANVVGAIQAVLTTPSAAGHTFFVSDGRDVSTPELVRLIAAAMDRPARLIPLPITLLRAIGRTGDVLARLGPTPLTSSAMGRLLNSLVVDSTKLRHVTGFVPPVTVEQGWSAVADWYRTGVHREA